MTIAQLCSHFEQCELSLTNTWRSYSTKTIYKVYLKRWIIPKWSEHLLSDIRTIEVESWLRSLPIARSTCAKIRNVLSVSFNHACRYEFFDGNPIRLVRQSAKRRSPPVVLTVSWAARRPVRYGTTDYIAGLIPHLRNAFLTRRRLMALESRVLDLENALDQLKTALVLVDGTGKCLMVNRAAQQICDKREGLFIRGRNLAARNGRENSCLQKIIAKAISAGMGKTPAHGGALLVSRDQRRPLQVMAAPFTSDRTGAPKEAVAIVFIADPDMPSCLASEVLRELYGLTPAETSLAMSLFEGNSLSEAADRIGVGRETVRTQVKSVLQKTGTQRQSELIRLLSALPAKAPDC